MIRKFLIVAALLTGGVALAQRPQTVEKKDKQSQELNAASKGSNFSQIDQMGIGSDATVEQQGTENASYIKQTGEANGKRNSATLLQASGFFVTSEKNYADMTQNGQNNNARTVQLGDENTTFTNQDGSKNNSYVQQGTFLLRRSDNNYADVNQKGKNNDAVILQIADNNTAVSNQYSAADARNGNSSFQSQISTFAREGNTAISNQAGLKNEAVQVQVNGLLEKGNKAQINQGDLSDERIATKSYAEQLQTGGGNEAYIAQELEGNVAYQKQVGLNNRATSLQNTNNRQGVGKNFTTQLQIGFDNHATSKQFGENSTSIQQQLGGGHSALTIQSFGDKAANYAATLQGGFDHSSTIQQRANGNYGMVDQLGTGHKSVINQNVVGGNGGNASINGSNTASVKQRNQGVPIEVSQNFIRSRGNVSPYQRNN